MCGDLIDAVERLLPQTQCRRCGFDGCRPYADAMVTDAVSIALCPPGGEATRQALSALLGRDDRALPLAAEPVRVACIVEADCIGCTRCLEICPADAIIGAAGRMHTVFSAWCTGCDLCAPVCPTACIAMPVVADGHHSRAQHMADARDRDRRRQARRAAMGSPDARSGLVELEADPGRLRAAVAAAVARRQDRNDER